MWKKKRADNEIKETDNSLKQGSSQLYQNDEKKGIKSVEIHHYDKKPFDQKIAVAFYDQADYINIKNEMETAGITRQLYGMVCEDSLNFISFSILLKDKDKLTNFLNITASKVIIPGDVYDDIITSLKLPRKIIEEKKEAVAKETTAEILKNKVPNDVGKLIGSYLTKEANILARTSKASAEKAKEAKKKIEDEQVNVGKRKP